jgi:diguanylate cyclase (GGDEF)-like protein
MTDLSNESISQAIQELSLAERLTSVLRKLKAVFTATHRLDGLVSAVVELLPCDGSAFVAWLPEKPGEFQPLVELGETIPSLVNFPELTDTDIHCLFPEKKACHFSINADDSPKMKAYLARTAFRNLLLIPYAGGYGNYGVLILACKSDCADWPPDRIALTHELVQITGEVADFKVSYDHLLQRLSQVESFLETSQEMASHLDLRDALEVVLEKAMVLFPQAADAHIFFYDEEVLKFGAARFRDESRQRIWTQPRENGLTYTVARSGNVISVEDMATHALFTQDDTRWEGSIVGVPLIFHERVIGVMTLAALKPHQFTEHDLSHILLLSDQAAIVIQNAQLHTHIRAQALTDPLTNLFNRRAFEKEVGDQIDYSHLSQRIFTLMVLDIDHFKQVNDTYGHPSGDEALRQISRCLRNNIRKTDFLARIGGDEFAVLLPDTPPEQAQYVAEKINQCLTHTDLNLPGGIVTHLSASYGMALYPQQATTLADLIQLADQALYLHKTRKQKSDPVS